MKSHKEYRHIYTDEELKKLQHISLDMAECFYKFCKENHLITYMCGGGCIGALRNGGFIPWDDDLDFFMPRAHYERFIKLWPDYEKGKDYALSVSGESYLDRNLFATLRDKNTTQVKPYQADLDIVHGVALDILPLDGYPDDDKERKKQVIWAYIYSLFRAGTVPTKHGGLMKWGSRVLLFIIRPYKLRYKIWSLAKKRMTKYRIRNCSSITELCSGPKYMKKRYDKEWFRSYREVPFSDRRLPIPVGAEDYLLTAFGDYTVLPPDNERVASHDCMVLDLDTPCREYRGRIKAGRIR